MNSIVKKVSILPLHTYSMVSESLIVSSPLKSVRKVNNFLFTRLLWEGLTDLQLEVLIEFSLQQKDDLTLEAIKAIRSEIPLYLVRKRVNALRLFFNETPFSRRLFDSIKNLTIECSHEKQFNDRPVQKYKYSGWKRHQNDHGSLNPHSVELFRQENTDIIVNNLNIIRSALTVGGFPSDISEQDISLLKSAFNKAETVKFSIILKEVFKDENL